MLSSTTRLGLVSSPDDILDLFRDKTSSELQFPPSQRTDEFFESIDFHYRSGEMGKMEDETNSEMVPLTLGSVLQKPDSSSPFSSGGKIQ